ESAAVDLDVRARETLHVLDDVRLRDVVEGAVRKPQVADRRVPEPSHFESSLALLAGHVADVDIVDIGALGPVLAFLVLKVDLENGFADLADLDVAEIDVLDRSAPHRVG